MLMLSTQMGDRVVDVLDVGVFLVVVVASGFLVFAERGWTHHQNVGRALGERLAHGFRLDEKGA